MSEITPAIVAEVENQLTLNRGLLAGFVFMVYDYVLNLGLEVDMIWTRKFSTMTFIYFLFRYLGLLWGITQFLHSWDINFTGYKCFVVFILNEPAQDVLLFLLQGMLTVRVYLLFGKSKLVLLCLVVGFVAAQGVSFTIAFMTWAIGPDLEKELEIAYLHTCEVQLPTRFGWFSPVSNSTLLGFEVMLSGFALRYAFKHLPKPFWRSPAQSLYTMTSVIVHDNLVYFLIALFGLVVNIIAGAPVADPCASCWITAKLARFLFLTMVGPWMILSSRIKHDRDVHGLSQSDAVDTTTVYFASRSIPF